jgi:hypothetical protein
MSTVNSPAQIDIEVRRKCAFALPLQFMLSDTQPIDLTGYTFAAQIRPSDGSDTTTATFTVTVMDAQNGELLLSLTVVNTTAIPNTLFLAIWDLIATAPGSEPVPFVEGKVRIYSGATA